MNVCLRSVASDDRHMLVVKSEKGCIEDNDVVSFFRWNQDTLLGCSRVQTIASVIADAFFVFTSPSFWWSN